MIIKATLAHLPQLVDLFDLYRIFYRKPSDKATAEAFLRERIRRGDSTIFVAQEDDQLAAFVQLYPLFSSTRMQPLWLLNDLYVLPEYRGRGLSVALIEGCKQHALDSGACGLVLETEKTNDVGNRLYPKTGFTLDREHNFYSWDC